MNIYDIITRLYAIWTHQHVHASSLNCAMSKDKRANLMRLRFGIAFISSVSTDQNRLDCEIFAVKCMKNSL